MSRTYSILLILLPTLLCQPKPAWSQEDQDPGIAGFTFGYDQLSRRLAVDAQHEMRKIIDSTGSYQNIELISVLHTGASPARKEAIAQARTLLDEGKNAYEQLDLDQALANFTEAVKKVEYGYGYLDRQALFLEALMYAGATQALLGEADKAVTCFERVHTLPGRKILDPNLFPPNIQEIFHTSAQTPESSQSGKLKVSSVPAGAKIYLDGRYLGGSPQTVADLPAGIHMVKALKDGFQPWGGVVKIRAARSRPLRIRMRSFSKNRALGRHLTQVQVEIKKGEPGQAATELSAFLSAQRLVLVAMSGAEANLRLRGYMCLVGEKCSCAHLEESLDSTSAAFPEEQKDFLLRLLSQQPETEDEGSAAAAALLASMDKDDGDEFGDFGLDLGDDTEVEDKSQPAPAPEAVAVSETESKPEIATTLPEETETEASLAQKTIEETRPEKPITHASAPQSAFYQEWWFWTAVAVATAGAATGTYFLVADDGANGGTLWIDMH